MKSAFLAFLEQFVELLNQGVLVGTPEGRILYANRILSNLLGIPANELVGRSAFDFYGGKDLALLEERHRVFADAEQYEFFLPHKDGSQTPVILNLKRLATPEGEGFSVITFTDITELKAQQRALSEAHELLGENHRRLRAELSLAARVQQSMSPRPIVWGNISVETFYEPVHTIGGDFG